ncbi:hemolysin III family protein [bacterium]|nr:MAG: hemolysin III family protein [bacterium]
MFLASGLYHSVCSSTRGIDLLRKFDHSAIYLLIAGTYTPFCLMAFHGFWQWGLLTIIWMLALVGIIANIWMINAPRWITAGVYLLMGWLIVLAFREMLASLTPTTIRWLFAGGIIYTLGAVVYSTKWLDFKPGVFGFHEVWHVFVMLAAAAHFVAVFSML